MDAGVSTFCTDPVHGVLKGQISESDATNEKKGISPWDINMGTRRAHSEHLGANIGATRGLYCFTPPSNSQAQAVTQPDSDTLRPLTDEDGIENGYKPGSCSYQPV